jgi:hypothetical protein
MEVQATSMCFKRNIHIYQQGQPTWRVVNFQPADASPCLHLSFHDGEHYNSVRCQKDSGTGPAEPICLEDVTSDVIANDEVSGSQQHCTEAYSFQDWHDAWLIVYMYACTWTQGSCDCAGSVW